MKKFKILFFILFLTIANIIPVCGQNINFSVADINNDGYIYIDDIEMLQIDLMTLAAPYRGDINGDDYINQVDLYLLIDILLDKVPIKLKKKLINNKKIQFSKYLLSFNHSKFSPKNKKLFEDIMEFIRNNKKVFKISNFINSKNNKSQ